MALQKLLAGLGFQSSLIDYKAELNLPTPFIAPAILETFSGYSFFSPPSAYDAMIYHNQDRLLPTISRISSQPKRRMAKEQYLQMALRDENLSRLNSSLHRMTTDTTGLAIRIPGQSPLYLQTSNEFNSTSLSFIRQSYISSQEFIMCPNPKRGFQIHQHFENLNMIYDVFGPLTMGVMESIGYPTARKPLIPHFELFEFTDEYDPAQTLFVQ